MKSGYQFLKTSLNFNFLFFFLKDTLSDTAINFSYEMINYVDAVIHVCLYQWNHSHGPQYPTVSDVKLPQQDAE